ncbi:MAG TPA: fibronectin type III domain-containing protein, partial [Tepidisphaeraceae bacterium]|nr:fibronectin type III domain-containing protein [Tepidisphaeraceae bacterium]
MSCRPVDLRVGRAAAAAVEALEGRVLLSGTLPASIHASPDALYDLSYDPATGYTLALSAGTYAFDANVGASAGDLPGLTLALSGTAVVDFNSPETLSGLSLSGTSKLTVTSSGGGLAGNFLDLPAGGFSLPQDPTTHLPAATLDLMDNDLLLRGGGDATVSSLSTLLKYSTGGVGLRSTDADDSPSNQKTALAFGDGKTALDGMAISASDVFVKYALLGDFNFDSRVNSVDYSTFNTFYGHPLAGEPATSWMSGDYSFDGRTNAVDYGKFSANFGAELAGPSFARSILPVGLAVTATEGQPLTGVPLATFTDTNNAASQVTQASDYTASVSWGTGTFSPTGVTVAADTDPADPNGFVVTATSTAPITSPDELISTQIQYAPTSSFQGRMASLGEPIVSITPAVEGLYAVPVSVSQMNLYWTLNATNATSIEVARSDDGGAYATLSTTAGGSATMFTDTTVSEGHTYSYEIRAVQPIGDSAYSDPAVATTYAVQGLSATAVSTTQIDLSWLNLSSDPAATLDVQRSSD